MNVYIIIINDLSNSQSKHDNSTDLFIFLPVNLQSFSCLPYFININPIELSKGTLVKMGVLTCSAILLICVYTLNAAKGPKVTDKVFLFVAKYANILLIQ